MFTTGEIVGLAEWIMDDTCLVLVIFVATQAFNKTNAFSIIKRNLF